MSVQAEHIDWNSGAKAPQLNLESREQGNIATSQEIVWPELAVNETANILQSLTPREREVLEAFSLDPNVKVMASTLGITEGSVNVSMSRLYGKVGVKSKKQAHAWVRLNMLGEDCSDMDIKEIFVNKLFSKEDVLTSLGIRQWQVLKAMAEGGNLAEIAARAELHEETTKSHIRQLKRKFDVESMHDLREMAIEIAPILERMSEPTKGKKAAEIAVARITTKTDIKDDGELDTNQLTQVDQTSATFLKKEGDGLNEPNMVVYEGFEAKRRAADKARKAEIVGAYAENSLDTLDESGILSKITRLGVLPASNEALLKVLKENGYISKEMLESGNIDLVGLLALEVSKEPSARAIVWGPNDSRAVAKQAFLEAIFRYEQQAKEAI